MLAGIFSITSLYQRSWSVHTPWRWNGWGPPITPEGKLTWITLSLSTVSTPPRGNRSWALWAPLSICRSTGTVGGTKLLLLMLNLKASASKDRLRLKVTSAPSGVGSPGGNGSVRGCKSLSLKAFMVSGWADLGSSMHAPLYRKIAEFTPFSNVVEMLRFPELGKARIQ